MRARHSSTSSSAPAIQEALLENGDIPVVSAEPSALAGSVPVDAARSGDGLVERRCKPGGLVPFLDYATPDFLNQEMAGIQELQAGQ